MNIHPEIVALLIDIDAFLEREGVTPTSFGWDAIKDPNLYRALKGGRIPSLPTLDRIRAFMAAKSKVAAA